MSDINTMRDAYEHWTAVGASDEKQAEARRKFDAILAAHDAAKRAEWEAEQGETEWEYGVSYPWHEGNLSHAFGFGSEPDAREHMDEDEDVLVRRRKAGPWLPVTDTTNNESEDEK